MMIMTPKFNHSKVPLDANTAGPTFPYYGSGPNYPVTLTSPIEHLRDDGWGMIGLPDPKRYNLEFDDLRNLKENSSIGFDRGSFTFKIDRRFDYGTGASDYNKDNITMDD